MNKQFFYGQYKRIGSFFEGSELAFKRAPYWPRARNSGYGARPGAGGSLHHRIQNPVNGNPEAVRNNLREATRLLREAGYEIRNQKLINAKTGEPMTVEFLLDEPVFERFVLFYKPILERLGIGVTVRTIDEAQYENRERAFDFDIIVGSWPESLSPGNEQRGYWGSQAADQSGSRNLIGIKNPAVDKLIDRVVFAKTEKTWSLPPRRSIACCSGTTTSCRSGPIARCGRRAGTGFPIRTNCPNTARRRFRPYGGGMRPGR